MKVKVIHEFADKDDFSKKYEVGEDVEFEDERAKNLIVRGLVEELKKVKEK